MGSEVASTFTPESVTARFDRSVFGEEIILKACYWLSRDFSCEIASVGPETLDVTIKPREKLSAELLSSAKDALVHHVADFALREKIDAKTAGIRDLLLAKAFSESGVFEDSPSGVFGDKVEEQKPRGMFKILSNSEA